MEYNISFVTLGQCPGWGSLLSFDGLKWFTESEEEVSSGCQCRQQRKGTGYNLLMSGYAISWNHRFQDRRQER